MTKESATISVYTKVSTEHKDTLDNAIIGTQSLSFSANKIVRLDDNGDDSDHAVNNPVIFEQLYNVLKIFEDERDTAYLDKAATPNVMTIGIGFNLDQWGNKLQDRIDHLYPILRAIGVTPGKEEDVYQKKQPLNAPQLESLFRITITGRQPDGEMVLDDSKGRKLQDQLLRTLDQQDILKGNEILALQSLVYTNVGLVGQNLRSAIKNKNGQEALRQIVEESNVKSKMVPDENNNLVLVYNHAVNGLAKRRLEEGALFSGNINLKLPDREFWDIIGWGRAAIVHKVNPKKGIFHELILSKVMGPPLFQEQT